MEWSYKVIKWKQVIGAKNGLQLKGSEFGSEQAR